MQVQLQKGRRFTESTSIQALDVNGQRLTKKVQFVYAPSTVAMCDISSQLDPTSRADVGGEMHFAVRLRHQSLPSARVLLPVRKMEPKPRG